MPVVYRGQDYEVETDEIGPYVVKNQLYNTNSKFNEVTARTMVYSIHYNFDTGEVKVSDVDDARVHSGFVRIDPHPNAKSGFRYHAWRWSRAKVLKDSRDLKFVRDGQGGKVFTKIRDVDGMTVKDLVMGPSTTTGQSDLKEIELAGVFDFPKPVDLIQLLVETASTSGSVVVDFFAGSGTTGHSVMAQNAADGGSRRFVLVQLPEPLDPEVKEQKVAAEFCDVLGKPRNIAELTKERLRRAGEKVRADNPMFAGDVGFRVFKLDSSNLTAWDPDREDLEESLLAAVESVKSDRSESDVLYELLLRLGIDLCVPIEEREIAGKMVHAVGGGVVLACLAERVGREDVEGLAEGIVGWIGELKPVGDVTCVFRDAAFDDDVVKTNVTAVLEQHGVTTVRSI
jgi:adenine-specific DNA-methyltransferase